MSGNINYTQLINQTINYLMTDKLTVNNSAVTEKAKQLIESSQNNNKSVITLNFSDNSQFKLYETDYVISNWTIDYLLDQIPMAKAEIINDLTQSILDNLKSKANTILFINQKTKTLQYYYGLGEKYLTLVNQELKGKYKTHRLSPTKLKVYLTK